MVLIQTFVAWTWIMILGLASIFHSKARRALAGRKSWRKQIAPVLGNGRPWAMVHCASIGEFQDVYVASSMLRGAMPGLQLLFTFQSPTGFEHFAGRPDLDGVLLLPFDTPRNARALLEMIRPRFLLFSRSEIWFNYLKTAREMEIPAFLVGFRVTNSNLYFKLPFRYYYRRCFELYAAVFCEDERSMSLLEQHQFTKNAQLAGNPRIDRIAQLMLENRSRKALRLMGKTIVAGSMASSDLPILASVIRQSSGVSHWIVAPHEVDEKTLRRWEKALPGNPQRWSSIDHDLPRILLLDTVGELPHFYQTASLAIVGGGFSRKGIHNILEPIAYGVPVATGPNHRGYPDALSLIRLEGLHIYHDPKSLTRWIESSPTAADPNQSAALKSYFSSQEGASSQISREVLQAIR